MPKLIAQPPVTAIDTASLVRKVLLWALGLGTVSWFDHARRCSRTARWIGPLMKARKSPNATSRESFPSSAPIGECDLDMPDSRTRLPVRWTEGLHAQTAKGLGFDPENPMVKVEVGILGVAACRARPNQESATAVKATKREETPTSGVRTCCRCHPAPRQALAASRVGQ